MNISALLFWLHNYSLLNALSISTECVRTNTVVWQYRIMPQYQPIATGFSKFQRKEKQGNPNEPHSNKN